MKSIQDWLLDDLTYTTPVMAIMTDKFGTEFVEWDPLTVNMEIKSAFGIEPSEILQDKIQAASGLLTTNLFYLSLEAFSAICNTLNLGVTASEIFLPADLEDSLWGITEAKLLSGPEMETDFSHNIARYVGFLLSEAGFRKPPTILAFAEYNEAEEQRTREAFLPEDEVLFKTFWENQKQERDGLEEINKLKLHTLFRQLDEIPVPYDKEFVKKGLGAIEKHVQSPTPAA